LLDQAVPRKEFETKQETVQAFEQLVASKDNEIKSLASELHQHRAAIQEVKGKQKQVLHTVQLSVQSAIKNHLEEFVEPAYSQL